MKREKLTLGIAKTRSKADNHVRLKPPTSTPAELENLILKFGWMNRLEIERHFIINISGFGIIETTEEVKGNLKKIGDTGVVLVDWSISTWRSSILARSRGVDQGPLAKAERASLDNVQRVQVRWHQSSRELREFWERVDGQIIR